MGYLRILLLMLSGILLSCSSDDSATSEPTGQIKETDLYFPPESGSSWQTTSIAELGWNTAAEQDLYDLLDEKGTKAFILLKNGKIVFEWYFDDHTEESPWIWASAGKTLTAFTAGIALSEGYLKITDRTSDYLGTGWTDVEAEKEDLITVWHQLTMTTGLDEVTWDCTRPDCLTYLADAGTRWSYHNAPYTLIQDVVANATEMSFENYFTTMLKDKIGMNGQWIPNGDNNTYWSTARSMARFGLLNLNNGVWNEETILGSTDYLNDMKNTSQDFNKSYGYLWWLNGRESAMIPSSQTVIPGALIPDGPEDLYAGLGKNDQKLYIVPSEKLVVVRMGEDTGQARFGPSAFDNQIWEKLNAIMQ